MTPVAENSLRKAAVFVRGLGARRRRGNARPAFPPKKRAPCATRSPRSTLTMVERRQRQTTTLLRCRKTARVELQLSTTAYQPAPQRAPQPETEQLDGATWFRQLRDADPQAIADYLSREQPRAIAVVLSYLAPGLSANVLQCLPLEEQPRVVAQLADQHDADPDTLRVIATGLADWVRRHQEEHQRRSTRVATIRQIVAATPEDKRRGLLATLAASEPHLAASLADLAPTPKPAPVAASPPPTSRPQPLQP